MCDIVLERDSSPYVQGQDASDKALARYTANNQSAMGSEWMTSLVFVNGNF